MTRLWRAQADWTITTKPEAGLMLVLREWNGVGYSSAEALCPFLCKRQRIATFAHRRSGSLARLTMCHKEKPGP